MNLHQKVFASFDGEFHDDERQVMVFLTGLAQEIIDNGGMGLASAASNSVSKYTATDLKSADKRKKAVAEIREAMGAEVSDTAIDSAIQAAYCNYRVMMANRPDAE